MDLLTTGLTKSRLYTVYIQYSYIRCKFINTVPSAVVWEESYCGILSPTLIKYVSSGSPDLAGQAFLFLSGFLFSFFYPPISPVFFLFLILHDSLTEKGRLAKEAIANHSHRVHSTVIPVHNTCMYNYMAHINCTADKCSGQACF